MEVIKVVFEKAIDALDHAGYTIERNIWQINPFSVDDYGGQDERMKREKIACNCKNVTYGMVEDAIKNGAKSYEDVEKQLRFGTGCGKCKEFIQFLIRDLLAEA